MEGNGQGPAVEVRDLVKRYPKGRVNAVDGVSFAVTPGEVFGLLGPNGAGKTTTVGILTTRVRPTGGVAWVAGVDVAADPVRARRLVAVVPQRNNLDRSLSIRQNLLFHAAYHGVPTDRAGPAGRRPAGGVRAGRAGRRQARHVLRRPGPAGHGGQGAHARAQGAVHGRADHRAWTRRPGCSSGTGSVTSRRGG